MKLTSQSGRHYETLNQIGRGGFGVVYLAESEDGTKHAVKLITSVDSEDASLSLENETKNTMELKHPNLLTPEDYGEHEGQPFIVSPYCPDGDFRTRMMQEGQSVQEICADFEQILEGLSALHSEILHRDLKPENILVDGDTLRISDFGLTKLVNDATRTMTFKGSGTPLYMAPEVWELDKIAIPADLYAVGVMFFEALTGQVPFQADNDRELQRLHISEGAPRVRSLRSDVSITLDGVVKKLLQKESAKRFQTAEEALAALKAANAAEVSKVSPIVEAMKKQHDLEEKERLEKQEVLRKQTDTASLNRYMEQQVIELFEDVVDEINSASPETQIEDKEMQEGERTYSFANRRLQVGFFRRFPEEHPEYPKIAEGLRNEGVAYGGSISIEQDGEIVIGWNLILIRTPESNYGDWKLLEVSMNAMAGGSFRNRIAPIDAVELTRGYAVRRATDTLIIKEKPLTKEGVENIVQHLIPSLVPLKTKAEEDRRQRSFEDRLNRRGYSSW